jgi:anti-sigma factor RsiW
MENLVGYLLGTLDPPARQRVEEKLAQDPSYRHCLEKLKTVLAPLAEDAEPPEPPPGLALRALALCAEAQCRLPPAPLAASRASPPPRWFQRVDVLVAACLLILVGGLTAPLLVGLWKANARVSCTNNLRKYWEGLTSYAEAHGQAFPRVEADGPRGVAGVFVPILADAGLVGGVSADCTAQGHVPPPVISMARMEELYRDDPEEFAAVARKLCGSYAYSLGYEEGHTLCGLTLNSGSGLPILADRPSAGGGNSLNHGGSGQNVLYVGGNVRWATLPTVGVAGDHIFLNERKKREAGVRRTDSVLAPGDARAYQSGE